MGSNTGNLQQKDPISGVLSLMFCRVWIRQLTSFDQTDRIIVALCGDVAVSGELTLRHHRDLVCDLEASFWNAKVPALLTKDAAAVKTTVRGANSGKKASKFSMPGNCGHQSIQAYRQDGWWSLNQSSRSRITARPSRCVVEALHTASVGGLFLVRQKEAEDPAAIQDTPCCLS